MSTTGQLKEAREFLKAFVEEWEHSVNGAQVSAIPSFKVLLAALEPVVVEDAHIERARELRREMLDNSPVPEGQMYPEDYAIKMMAQAIADGETRGQLKSLDLIESGWGVIANCFDGDWTKASAEWRGAAKRYRDAYHALLKERA